MLIIAKTDWEKNKTKLPNIRPRFERFIYNDKFLTNHKNLQNRMYKNIVPKLKK